MTEVHLGIRQSSGGVEGWEESAANFLGFTEQVAAVPGQLGVCDFQGLCSKVGTEQTSIVRGNLV